MKDFGAIMRGHAHEILARVCGAEFLNLDAHSAELIVQDYLEAEDEGCGAREYARRIGDGNLQAYVDVMLVRERKGWDG